MVAGKTCSTSTPARINAAVLWLCVLFVSLLLSTDCSNGASDTLITPPDARCACPGDVLTYTCSIIGGGNTLWRGTAFDCSNSADQILLRHSQYGSGGTRGDCTGGTLAARSLRVENGNCYVSELEATVSTALNGQSIRCEHNSNTGTRLIGESILNIISASNHYPSPTNVNLSGISDDQVSFSWDAICSSVEFIVDSDCGVCPPSTNTSTVTCAEFQLPTVSNATMCSFGINGRVCGITSDLITTAVLRVPEVPMVSIIPSYFNESGTLARMELSLAPGNQSEVISNDISGPVLNYIPVILSPDNLPYGSSIPAQPSERPFNFTLDVPSAHCSSATDIRVNVSAANRVGQGFPSNARTIGCVNNFVQVNFDSDSTITCTFSDEVDATEKYCRIDYGLLNEGLTYSAQGSSNENTVSLSLTNLISGQYQYIVLAGSGVATVRVEGNFTKVSPKGNDEVVVVAIVVPVGVILVLLLTTVVTVILIWHCRRSKPSPPDKSETGQGYVPLKTKFKDPNKLLELEEISGRELQEYEVTEDSCALDEFVTKCKRTYRRGYAFYELTDKKEDVHGGKEIIVWNKTTGKFFTPTVTSETLKAEGLVGEGVTRPHYRDKYCVFIQSMGSGKRHVKSGTYILLANSVNSDQEHTELVNSPYPSDPKQQKQQHTEKDLSFLSPVPNDYFVTEVVEVGISLEEFQKKRELAKKKLNIFLELAQLQLRPNKIRDVLLMENKPNGQLFSDPMALDKVKRNKEDEIDSKWKVLVLGEYESKVLGLTDKTEWYEMTLKPGMQVAYENPKFVGGFKICALTVTEDNVRMSDFVTKGKGSFESGKAFYEFKDKDEDLLYCRKAMNIPKGVIQQLQENDDSSAPAITWNPEATIATFYSVLPNAPGVGISPPSSKDYVLFIHSTSQGARCLKNGTRVLYNVGVENTKKATGDHKGENGEGSEERPSQPPLSVVPSEGGTESKV